MIDSDLKIHSGGGNGHSTIVSSYKLGERKESKKLSTAFYSIALIIAINIICISSFAQSANSLSINANHDAGDLLIEEILRDGINILKFQKKIISSTELDVEVFDSIHEIHVICDTLHIDSDLPSQYRGKNLIITATNVKVHKSATWDLSGLVISQNFSLDAGQDENEIGLNGANGRTGNNGGNFILECDSIENPTKLTIISNGSDGTNGQNAGNGCDGDNGVDATEKSFIRNNVKFQMPYDVGTKNKFYNAFDLEELNKANVQTDDGLEAFVYIQPGMFEDYGLMLVEGSKGLSGYPGGSPGFGSLGGLAGNITIKFKNGGKANLIKRIANPGKNGKSGTAGLHGTDGLDGRDLFKYDQRSWNHPYLFGLEQRVKYRLEWTDQNNSYSVKDYTRSAYVHVVINRYI